MEKIFEKTLLYDFYGELLTERQREIYEEVVFNDMSLSEAAQEYGISRQGVHDMIRRCDAAMASYEEKLHLLEQFGSIKKAAGRIQAIVNREGPLTEENRREIGALTGEILTEIG